MDYDACLIRQNGGDSHSRPIQKLTDEGYLARLCYHKQKGRDLIQA